MIGIKSYGAYIPIYRLSESELARAWGGRGGRGEIAVANYDEDSITMAVEAAIDCLNGTDRDIAEGLYFASTTPPYSEKMSASIVAAASDLRDDLFTLDIGNSLRCGTSAIKAALDAIKSGSAKNILVTAADCRLAPPASEFEPVFGDGAAAFIIGDSDVAVAIEDSHSISSDFLDVWKRAEDPYIRTWEDRFILQYGYSEKLGIAVSALLKKTGLSAKDFAKVVYYAPNARSHQRMIRQLKVEPEQVQAPMFDSIGNTGAAFAPMMLVAALEEAKPGDRILWANYGDGADAFILQVTDQIEKVRDRRGIKRHLESKMEIPNYEKYIRFRNLMQGEADRRPQYISSLPMIWRDRKQVTPLHGGRCRKCGNIQFPIQRVCAYCQAKDDYEEVRLADKKATVFTFSMDERAVEVDPPRVWTINDLDGGGRIYCTMTDRDTEQIEIGMGVEMTFRKIHEGAGLHNYFWKCRPIRVS
ncbi:MAG: hydroxymethylglutaryl-CoA synthase [Dehalococcoidia bacterium]|nr:hydroxymethylglutaryl-CoA synthase [Dehalococcoidia bacterium]